MLLLLLALPAVVQAQFNYTTNNGTITITGYTGPGGPVSIPDTISGLPVTRIMDNAFDSQSSLTSVMIPKSVSSIGRAAFANCYSLAAITVDDLNSFYSSADGVLFNRSQTVLIQYPGGKAGGYTILNSVTSIVNYAFSSCSRLTSVTIPNGVATIGENTFSFCTSLTSVTIPNSVTSIEGAAFWGSGLTSIAIPDSVTSIGSFAFINCASLTSVTIGNSVTRIGDYAFANCSSLTSVTIPNSVTIIGDSAFFGTSLSSVTIPNRVTSIGDFSFASCASLTSVRIGNSVTSIGRHAFRNCYSLTSVTIPKSVTSIGEQAFVGCTRLAGVYFEWNAPSVGLYLFLGANNATVYYLAGTTGWDTTFADRPAVLWDPQVQTSDASFGVQANQFGFTITGISGLVVVVEACTNLVNPAWSPVGTKTLTGGSSYFSDPQWTNYPTRLYRLRSP